jgi:hypothetical protein
MNLVQFSKQFNCLIIMTLQDCQNLALIPTFYTYSGVEVLYSLLQHDQWRFSVLPIVDIN